MDRPYVICHVVTTVDGRMEGKFFSLSASKQALMLSRQMRADYACQALLNGDETCASCYADGRLSAAQLRSLERQGKQVRCAAYLEALAAIKAPAQYLVCLDGRGDVAWRSGVVEKSYLPASPVIEILPERVSDGYLAYLQMRGVSWILCGREQIDLPLCLHTLRERLGIERLQVTGGGAVNYALLQAGLIDELCVILLPVIEGDRSAPTSFDSSPLTPPGSAVPLRLQTVETLPGGALCLRYAIA